MNRVTEQLSVMQSPNYGGILPPDKRDPQLIKERWVSSLHEAAHMVIGGIKHTLEFDMVIAKKKQGGLVRFLGQAAKEAELETALAGTVDILGITARGYGSDLKHIQAKFPAVDEFTLWRARNNVVEFFNDNKNLLLLQKVAEIIAANGALHGIDAKNVLAIAMRELQQGIEPPTIEPSQEYKQSITSGQKTEIITRQHGDIAIVKYSMEHGKQISRCSCGGVNSHTATCAGNAAVEQPKAA